MYSIDLGNLVKLVNLVNLVNLEFSFISSIICFPYIFYLYIKTYFFQFYKY